MEALMRRDLCQTWNCSPAELAQMDARTVMHETALIRLYEASLPKPKGANRG